jgi:hypothetical protein
MAKRYKFQEDKRINEPKKKNDKKLEIEKTVEPESQIRKGQTIKPPHKKGLDKGTLKSKKILKMDESEPKELVERFDKAFLFSLGLIALLTLLFFIPIIGPFIGLTFVPYISCNLGCKYVQRRNGLQVGALVGLLWSIVEVYMLFQILTFIKISVADPGIYSNLDMAIIVAIFTTNLLFCMIGGYTGGAKFNKK